MELRYQDDYMEEPIEIEIPKNYSHFEKFIDLFKQKCNMSYKHWDYIGSNCIQSMGNIYPECGWMSNCNSSTYIENPQVLSNILKYHLDIAYQNINILNEKLFLLEITKVEKDIAVWDAISMCKKALNGSPFIGGNSPFLGGNSPIVGQDSPFNWISPVL